MFLRRIFGPVAMVAVLASPSVGQQLTEHIRVNFNGNTSFDYDVNTNTNPGNNRYHHYFGVGHDRRDMPSSGEFRLPRVTSGRLDLQVNRNSGTINDRIELRLVHGGQGKDAFAPKFGENLEFGFAVKIRSGGVPTSDVNICQLWQRGETGTVPVTLTIAAGGWDLYLKTTYTDSNGVRKASSSGKYLGTLSRNRFTNIRVRARAQHIDQATRGYAEVRFDAFGTQDDRTVLVDNISLGTKPGVNGGENSFDVRMGIYRVPQLTTLRLFFDNLYFKSDR